MSDNRLRVLLKIPNVSAKRLEKLTAFLNGAKNKLPQNVAGPSECAELLGAEKDSANGGYQVSLLVTLAYPYAGGQTTREHVPRSVMDALYESVGIFPKKGGGLY